MGDGVMQATDNKPLSGVLRTQAMLIDAPDYIPALALREAADRIDDLAALAKEMAGMLAHDRALPDGCKACAMQKRLAELGVVV